MQGRAPQFLCTWCICKSVGRQADCCRPTMTTSRIIIITGQLFSFGLLLPKTIGEGCKTTQLGKEYMGTLAETTSGRSCQRWASRYPHSNEFKDDDFPDQSRGHNYCRNPDDKPGGPWCFPDEYGVPWEYCHVHWCNTACKTIQAGQDYMGTLSVTKRGRVCQRWDQQYPHHHDQHANVNDFPEKSLANASNFCRNPTVSAGGPWCFTIDPFRRWEFCDVPWCTEACKTTQTGREYNGTLAKTKTGKTCQRWEEQTPHQHNNTEDEFPEKSLPAAEGYCRNPDEKSGGPWCFTKQHSTRWEYCDVALCYQGDPRLALEAEVRRNILRDYDPDELPTVDPEMPPMVYVYLGAYTLLKIIELDGRAEELKTLVHLVISWDDERLNYLEHRQLGEIDFGLEEVWVPYIVLYNSVGQQGLYGNEDRVKVSPFGSAQWTGVVTLTSTCEMDVTIFPLDEQICEQEFSMIPPNKDSYSFHHIGYVSRELAKLVDAPYSEDSAWTVNRTAIETYTRNYGDLQVVVVRMKLARKYGYYSSRVLAPVLILSLLVVSIFFIPPDAGEKISFGVALLLTFSFFQLSLEDQLPKTSKSTPLITIAMVLLQVCSATSIMGSVLVLGINYLPFNTNIPAWTRFVFFKVLAKITFHQTAVNLFSKQSVNIDEPEPKQRDVKNTTEEGKDSSKVFRRKTQSEVETLMEQIVDHLLATGEDQNEWKLVALILDRMLMYVCLLTMMSVHGSILYLLVQQNISKD